MTHGDVTAPPTGRDPALEVVTFGCRLNAVESQLMRARAAAAGLTDAVLINTCAVTVEAERQARQAVRRLRRAHPDRRIIVTGCAVQIDPAAWAAMPEVDRVLGNSEKLTTEAFGTPDRVQVGDIMAAPAATQPSVDLAGHSRAFLQVQNGCDHRCTFCVIPFGRGPSRSVPVGAVVSQARALVAKGYTEIVLTGVDLTAWGADLPGRPALGDLCRRLLTLVPDLPRLRLSSLDPVEIDDTLLGLLGDAPRLMPHLHLSVQAGDDMILKRMKRRHLRDDVLRLADRARARRPDIVFGADLIAGFPTETDAMFDNTLRLVDEAGLTWLHVFPYSARPGTPASRMPAVPGAVRRARAAALRAAGDRQAQAWRAAQVGRRARIVMERDGTGHSEHFGRVRPGAACTPGTLVEVEITHIEQGMLAGLPVLREAA
ncbi:tRNA (N(6)-L-threonylcarbamoyladenosine(37)-C(2))-methylthiotransferase MtaB [Vineibacter terrae]|uniref:tRNA (N(6)-L-threonylcarbamoyladenosine(37)-C(2))- methylthiotransferase MtaB n=1 Tax=Vineibacter terrae TaxID=2586908 RepID=UPI002E3361AC|nr:tRNA (N(6)-L-threonylcarbamoyladenosine(37)-C(2))-methylthiotransferase MtaB [Vineibacter terrae]HEX2885130.1 tRNA (N(6)-L-threonylcarbamoyladenosine(37)-C(2))-methylthiotransferase MtaB [Vineibacter terrae]